MSYFSLFVVLFYRSSVKPNWVNGSGIAFWGIRLFAIFVFNPIFIIRLLLNFRCFLILFRFSRRFLLDNLSHRVFRFNHLPDHVYDVLRDLVIFRKSIRSGVLSGFSGFCSGLGWLEANQMAIMMP